MKTLFLSLLAVALCTGQVVNEGKPASSNIMGAEYAKVRGDLSITFRLKAPDAKKVQVDLGVLVTRIGIAAGA